MADIWLNITKCVFLLLCATGTVLAIRQRRLRTDDQSALAIAGIYALFFALVALDYFFGDIVSPTRAQLWGMRAEVSLLALFPPLLYLFLHQLQPQRYIRLIIIFSVILSISAFFLPDIPAWSEVNRDGYYLSYKLLLMIEWLPITLWSLHVVLRASKNQATITQRRMQSLFVSMATVLTYALLFSLNRWNADGQAALFLLGSSGAAFFWFGIYPPSWLRSWWRLPDNQRIRLAMIEKATAGEPEDIYMTLLPHWAGLIGARNAIYYREQVPLAIWGSPPAITPPSEKTQSGMIENNKLYVKGNVGWLVVELGDYAPPLLLDDAQALSGLVILAEVLEAGRQHEREYQALVLNDAVVQGLVLAKLAHEAGQEKEAWKYLDEALESAKQIITRLIHGAKPGSAKIRQDKE